MTRKRYVKGDRSFRKILRRLPDEMKAELQEQMDLAGDALLAAMRADAPRRTGKLAQGLSKKLLKGSLQLKVGFIGKPVNRRLFYGRIVEFGRKAQTVTVRRLNRGGRTNWLKRVSAGTARARIKPGDLTTTYQLRVRARAGRPFVYSPRTELRKAIGNQLRGYWNDVLARVATGDVGDE